MPLWVAARRGVWSIKAFGLAWRRAVPDYNIQDILTVDGAEDIFEGNHSSGLGGDYWHQDWGLSLAEY